MICTGCSKALLLSNFWFNTAKNRYIRKCGACVREVQLVYEGKNKEHLNALNKQWRLDNLEKCKAVSRKSAAKFRKEQPERYRRNCERARLKMQYGITPEFLVSEQARLGGCCPVCSRVSRLVVDHNHLTGRFRSLLCFKCNTTLGQVNDSVVILSKLVEYLVEHDGASRDAYQIPS